MNCRKPEQQIYEQVQSEQDWKGESCILVDDRKENLKSAQDLGWTAVRFGSGWKPQVAEKKSCLNCCGIIT